MAENTAQHSQPSHRVSRACQRCRRQKLKCDEARPCTLCSRSGVRCQVRSDNLSVPASQNARKRPGRVQGSPRGPRGVNRDKPKIDHSYSRQDYGASSSAVGFAVNVFGESAALSPSGISSIPGHVGPQRSPRAEWSLKTMVMPSPAIMDCLLRAYFDHTHWFILMFHEADFMQSVSSLLRQSAWDEDSRGQLMTALVAAAIGLECVSQDNKWPGHTLLASSSFNAASLQNSLIEEVRVHVVDLLDDCTVESVQVCLLLGTYYIYHGSPALAWNMFGISVRTACALSLHCESAVTLADPVRSQVYRRTWNHLIVADTYAAMIYGRPASLDAAFCNWHELTELEDTRLPASVAHLDQGSGLTGLSFSTLKYRLYEIMRSCLHKFRLMNLQSTNGFASLVETILEGGAALSAWKAGLPLIFNHPSMLETYHHPDSEALVYKRLFLQSQILQLTYDSAVIFVNRPLLEYQARPEFQAPIAENQAVVRSSLDLCFKAALRVSHVSADFQKSEFSLSFLLMNFFTAGVIMCLAPTLWPFSKASTEAKAGVLRIVRASRRLRNKSQIARHTDQLLTRLLRSISQQELENVLGENDPTTLTGMGEHHLISSRVSPANPSPSIPTEQCSQPASQEQHPQLSPYPPLDQSALNDLYSVSNASGADPLGGTIHGLEPDATLGLGVVNNNRSQQIDHYMDETLSTFGEMLFNLVPNDPYSAWNWGNNIRWG